MVDTKKETKTKRKRVWGHNNAQHAYYERNRKEICDDLLGKGRLYTRQKWNIPSTSLFSLEKRWLTAEQKQQVDNVGLLAVQNERLEDGLPSFPAWNEGWPTDVQLIWLQVYGKLVDSKKGGTDGTMS